MNEYAYNLKIKAASKEDADKIARALNVIYQNAESQDLIVLAKAVENKPSLIKKALKYIKFI
jgi:hypothetical protein